MIWTSFRHHPKAREIEETRHHQMMGMLIPNVVSAVGGGGLTWALLKEGVPEQAQWTWLFLNTFMICWVAIVYVLYRYRESLLTTIQWGLLSRLSMFLWGLLWSATPFIFLHDGDLIAIVILSGIIVGLCITPINSMALYMSGYIAFISPVLVGLSWRLMQIDPEIGKAASILSFFYWSLLMLYVMNTHTNLIKIICMQLEKTDALKESEQANIAKSRFLAAASHDLRQPLQAINLFSSAIELRLKNKETEELFDNLQSSIGTMSELLNSLLDVSKLESQVVEVNMKSVLLKDIADKLYNAYLPQFTEKGIVFDYQAQECYAETDGVLIERAMSNLLSNALRYTDKGEVRFYVVSSPEDISISVVDTGKGIPDDQHEAVFAEFYQIDNPGRDRQKGLGLGLSIVKRICSLLGHSLKMESELHKGSSFTMLLEKAEAPAEEANNGMLQSYDISGLQVLVLDDEESIRSGLQALLDLWECEARCCESFEEAAPLLQNWNPDIILSDYRLHDRTGSDAVRDIFKLMGKEVPTVLITADTSPERMREAGSSGFELLFKPVKPMQLRLTIEKLLKKAAN